MLRYYNSDGTVDTTFTPDLWLTADFAQDNDVARSMVVSDEQIVLGGYTGASRTQDFAVALYHKVGKLLLTVL